MKTINIPEEYKPLFNEDWREAAVFGGRYSLKSHSVARFLIIKARADKKRIACFREFQNSIAESSHQLLSELINKYELKDFEITDKAIINTVTGSDFIFKGLWNNEQSIKSIEGIDIAWVEEAQTVSEKSIEVLTPTVRKENSKIIYTYNRLLEDDPVHKRLVIEGRPDTLIINENFDIAIKYNLMPDVILKEIEDDKKFRPALYKHKWLGEPNTTERRIYRDWAIIDEIPHEARLEAYGLDFGYANDPTAIVAVYYYNGGYIFDEICYQKGLSNKEIADVLKLHERKVIIADSAEPKSIDEINLYGLNIQPTIKGQGSVSQGIQFVQGIKCSITKHSQNLLKEYKGYIWDEDKNGVITNTPVKMYDHCFVGDTLIKTINGDVKIKDIKEDDLVLTSKGYKRVLKKWDNGMQPVNKYSLQFGMHKVELTCTKEHKIKSKGWRKISKLKPMDQISFIRPLMDIDLHSTVGKDTFLVAIKECMFLSGNTIMVKSQEDSVCTTKIQTLGTIKLIILNLLKNPSIVVCMLKDVLEIILNLLRNSSNLVLRSPKNGINLMKEKNGIKNREKGVGRIRLLLRKYAKSALRNMIHTFHQDQSFVIKTVKLKHLEVGEEKKERVYDLTIEDAHEYFANGILVHNCMDALRYALAGRIVREQRKKTYVQEVFDRYSAI